MKKFYDVEEFREIISAYKTDPFRTRIKLEQYLNKYPKDNGGYIYYINCLITVGEFNKALNLLNKIEEKFKDNTIYSDNIAKRRTQMTSIVYAKLRVLLYLERYKEAYELYLNTKDIIDTLEIKPLFYCKKKLGLLNEEELEERPYNIYYNRQVIDYQESDFINHVKKHFSDYKYNDEEDPTEFSPSFPLEKVIEEVKKYIPSDKRLFPGFSDNLYIFRYDNCGIFDKGVIHYFKVITFHNSKDIITMYPSIKCDNLPYVDLNYMKVEDNPKVKRLSQIDKFNKKFGIK